MEVINEDSMNSKIAEIKKKTDEIVELEKIESLIQTNSLEFEFNKVKYRVRKPTYEERLVVNQKRAQRYTELLKDETMLLEEDLIRIYKKRGIDVDAITNEYSTLEKQKNELLGKLGKALKDGKPDTELVEYRKEIEALLQSMQQLQIKRLILLDSSIEAQIQIHTYTYLAFLITEKLIEDNFNKENNSGQRVWKKAWDSYEELLSCEEALVNTAIWYTGLVSKNEIQSL